MKRLPEFSFLTGLDPRAVALTALLLALLATLAVRCGMSEEETLERYLELRERVSAKDKGERWRRMDNLLNRRIIANERLLQKKITMEVDRALQDYESKEKRSVTMLSPIVLQEAQRLRGTQQLILEQAIYYELDDGSMGIRGAWTKPWPNEIITVERLISDKEEF